jgi:hypothetical protein
LDLKLETYIKKHAFLCGIISKDEFVSFIDDVIASHDNPPYEFIKAAFNSQKSALDLLSPINEYLLNFSIDYNKFSEGFIQIIREKYLLGIDLRDLVKKTSHLPSVMSEFYDIENDEMRSLVWLGDDFNSLGWAIYSELDDLKEKFEVTIGLREPADANKQNKALKIIETIIFKSEAHKKLFSILFFLISSVILVPIILFTNNDIVTVFALIALGINLILSIVYYIKGTALAAMCFTYYLIFVISLSITLFLSLFVELPKFMDSKIFSAIGILIITTFTVVMPLPKRVKEMINDKLENKPKRADIEEIYKKSYGFETREIESVDYETFVEYKGSVKYAEKPYNIAYANPILFWLRIIIGFILVLGGIIGYIVSTNSEDTANHFLNSWVFWLFGGSVTAFFTGSTIVWAGFIRASVVPIFCTLLGLAGYFVYEIIKNIYVVSFIWGLIFTILASILVLSIIPLSIIALTKKQRRTLSYFERENNIFGVDLTIYDVCPITDYTNIANVTIKLDKNVSLNEFDKLNDKCLLFCSNKKVILTGAIIKSEEKIYNLFFYYKTKKQYKSINRFLKRNLSFNYEILTNEDKYWEIYKKNLYPEKTE